MDTETCTIFNIEKHINNFYKRDIEFKDCHRTRKLNRYYENNDKISIQQINYYEKNRDKIFLQKQNNRPIQIEDLLDPMLN